MFIWTNTCACGKTVMTSTAEIYLATGRTAKSPSYMSEYPLPFKPSRCIKTSFYIPENRLNFPTTNFFSTKISMKLVYQYMVNFFNFSPASSHLHPLQVVNCDSNSRLVVDEDDNGKFRPERVNKCYYIMYPFSKWYFSISPS